MKSIAYNRMLVFQTLCNNITYNYVYPVHMLSNGEPEFNLLTIYNLVLSYEGKLSMVTNIKLNEQMQKKNKYTHKVLY